MEVGSWRYLDGVEFVDPWPEVVRISPECDLQQRQEAIHPSQQTLRPEKNKHPIIVAAAGELKASSSDSAAHLTCWPKSSWRESRQTR